MTRRAFHIVPLAALAAWAGASDPVLHARSASMTADTMSPDRTTTDTLDRNKQAVRTLYELALNQRRLELIDTLIDASYVGARGERGPAGFRDTIAMLLTAFPDLRFDVDTVIAEGDRVVIRWRWQATHTGPMLGIPASGRPVRDTGISIYELHAGRIVTATLETDRLGVLQQIGIVAADVVPGRPAPAAR